MSSRSTRMQTNRIKKQKLISVTTQEENAESHPSCSTTPKNNEVIEDPEHCTYTTLFERIFSGVLLPAMPNGSWAIHRSSLPARAIVASELRAVADTSAEFPPLYIKQIVFDAKLNFEVFFVNTKTVLKEKPKVPQSLEEFENVLAYINHIKLCPGGPAVTEYSNVDLECAHKDPTERWRHNLCSLETVDDLVCKSCFSLQEIIQRHVRRYKLSGRNLPYSRKQKRKVGSKRLKRI